MHCTVAFLDEYSLPNSFWTENPLPGSYLLKRNSARYPLIFKQNIFMLTVFASFLENNYRKKVQYIIVFCNVTKKFEQKPFTR